MLSILNKCVCTRCDFIKSCARMRCSGDHKTHEPFKKHTKQNAHHPLVQKNKNNPIKNETKKHTHKHIDTKRNIDKSGGT